MVLFNCGQVRVGKNPCTQGEGSDQKGHNGPTRELEWNGVPATEVLQDKVNTDRYGHSRSPRPKTVGPVKRPSILRTINDKTEKRTVKERKRDTLSQVVIQDAGYADY